MHHKWFIIIYKCNVFWSSKYGYEERITGGGGGRGRGRGKFWATTGFPSGGMTAVADTNTNMVWCLNVY